ncbi:hypothetical protein [Nitrogeniibacter aestuarii]|uniref:hypothetical protein n=1 Tax=Nitrogeniibacter aestuarii TaxID=2815343 RepID=UPI001D12CB81|nr:hypothetical protein [Nitrogeniibacter aestuarii]
MKTKMIAAVIGVSSMLTTGAVLAADQVPQEPYYEAIQGDNQLATPPHGEMKKDIDTMEGKSAYGEPSDGDTRYSEEILSGQNKNEMNDVADPVHTGETLPKGAGHKAYDKATEPN